MSEPPPPEVDAEAVAARYSLLRSVGEECITEEELKNLVAKKPSIRCYDGFEPSGRMHIAQGIYKAVNVNKCTAAGCEFVFWVADWFALMNDKMGGELEKIRTVGEYLIEVWSAAGMDMTNVTFLWSSEEINRHAADYWRRVLDIGRRNTLARIKKCCTIMGKSEGNLSAAQILYPLMQCADIFYLKADICQLGLDQRKVNMLAREYCNQIKRKLKPVVLSHHMLAGLKEGQAKMSKSDPDSAIFMEDTAEDVARKISAAYCPRVAQQKQGESVAEDGLSPTGNAADKNPCLDYLHCIVFSKPGATLRVGEVVCSSYEELEAAFLTEKIDERSLKEALIGAINGLLEPVRCHFRDDERAKGLLEKVMSYRKGGAAPPLCHAPVVPAEKPRLVAWLPVVTKFTVDSALRMIKACHSFLDQNKDQMAEAIVIAPDWSAFSRDELTGDEKDISTVLECNKALLLSFGLQADRVKIVQQSAFIVDHASEYWVRAISVGRKVNIGQLDDGQGFSRAGDIVAGLMKVADATLLRASHFLSMEETLTGAAALIPQYTEGKIAPVFAGPVLVPALCQPGTAPSGPDDLLFCDDSELDIRRKVKRAYAAPAEADSPVLAVAGTLVGMGQRLAVARNEANGGDVAYTDAAAVLSDYAAAALHPADLKGAVAAALLELTANARKGLAAPEMKKLSQAVKSVEKKLAKNKQ